MPNTRVFVRGGETAVSGGPGDEPVGTLSEAADGSGAFTEVLLRPTVTVTDRAMLAAAEELHDAVLATCFIARSVNFPVRHQPTTRVAS